MAFLISACSATKHLFDELLKEAAVRLCRATDDQSLGHCELVTDLLLKKLESTGSKAVYIFDTLAMIEAVAGVSKEFDVA